MGCKRFTTHSTFNRTVLPICQQSQVDMELRLVSCAWGVGGENLIKETKKYT